MMNELQERIWDQLSELSGEEVLKILTDWHGLQLLDEDFAEFVEKEIQGY